MQEEEALSFIYESIIDYEDFKFLEGETLLLLQSDYFQNDFDLKVGFKNYDATITMLKYTIKKFSFMVIILNSSIKNLFTD